jgi:hypothetical protein
MGNLIGHVNLKLQNSEYFVDLVCVCVKLIVLAVVALKKNSPLGQSVLI